MATLFTHALVGAALGQAASPGLQKQPSFWATTIVCSMLPDVDVIGFSFGIHYGDLWGHRGMTHSLLFAAVVGGLLAWVLGKTARERWWLAVFLFLVTASHGALDAMTNGGLGIAFFSPFDTTRYFFPWRPIAVSPIGADAFFSVRGLHVLWTEICWLWGPTLLIGVGLRGFGRLMNAEPAQETEI
ncbi:MAG: metal-dependent hydrolase [Acidobacteriia bacterium]|nr:metal-dependent hydrolase [Terriglobia bacterium]